MHESHFKFVQSINGKEEEEKRKKACIGQVEESGMRTDRESVPGRPKYKCGEMTKMKEKSWKQMVEVQMRR